MSDDPRSYLLFFANLRSVFFTFEQPSRSLLLKTDVVQAVLGQVRAVSQSLWMGGWGGLRLQHTVIWSTMPQELLSQLHKTKQEALARVGPRNRGPTPRADDDSDAATSPRGESITLGEIYPSEFSIKLSQLIESLLSADARGATAVHAREIAVHPQ
eukprot:9488777-Pyramimonas_sp.AAC.4